MSINESNFSFFQADGVQNVPPVNSPADSAEPATTPAQRQNVTQNEQARLTRADLDQLPYELQAIRQHWERRGRKYGLSPSASWVDETMLHHEGIVLSKYLNDNDRVLDAGCANGYTTIQLARLKRIRITGIDYAQSMVDYASMNLGRAGTTRGSISFRVDNFLHLDFPDNTFDKVITKRCMINLGSPENHKQALLEAWRVLKPGGLFLMSEVSTQASDNLNRLRETFGLETMTPLWHNCYIDEDELLQFARPYFELKKIKKFSSSYYVLTWVLYPFFRRNGNRNYRGWFHRFSTHVPQVGDWGLQKLYILKKRAV
ncbi:MAG TPA: class I SAM-dependent methyltransferase [Chloroflexia bacterium]|nr:class I SAM-dependent methyltransferase [Chloroflexia bacterium]